MATALLLSVKIRKWRKLTEMGLNFANFLFSLVSKIFANRCDLASWARRLGEIQEIRFLHSFKYLNKISHLDIHWHNFANLKDNIKNPFRKFLRHKILANVGEEFSSWIWLLEFCICQNRGFWANSVQCCKSRESRSHFRSNLIQVFLSVSPWVEFVLTRETSGKKNL